MGSVVHVGHEVFLCHCRTYPYVPVLVHTESADLFHRSVHTSLPHVLLTPSFVLLSSDLYRVQPCHRVHSRAVTQKVHHVVPIRDTSVSRVRSVLPRTYCRSSCMVRNVRDQPPLRHTSLSTPS